MSSRERNMLIILGVLAVAALAFFLLTSGDEEPEEAAAPTPDTSSPAVTTPPEPQEEEEEAEQAVDFLGGRDPFDPLVVEVEGGGEAPTDDTTTGDTTTGDTTTGDTTTGGTGSEGETEDVTLTGRPVTLVSISSRGSKDVAQVEVDGQTFTVSEGQRFSRHFELVSISRHCARFLYGDQSFSLCEEVAPR